MLERRRGVFRALVAVGRGSLPPSRSPTIRATSSTGKDQGLIHVELRDEGLLALKVLDLLGRIEIS